MLALPTKDVRPYANLCPSVPIRTHAWPSSCRTLALALVPRPVLLALARLSFRLHASNLLCLCPIVRPLYLHIQTTVLSLSSTYPTLHTSTQLTRPIFRVPAFPHRRPTLHTPTAFVVNTAGTPSAADPFLARPAHAAYAFLSTHLCPLRYFFRLSAPAACSCLLAAVFCCHGSQSPYHTESRLIPTASP